VRQAKDNNQVPARYYRPEQVVCPRCGQTLKRCYPLWRKYVVFLDGRYLVVSLGYSCQNLKCAWRDRVYESQAARRLTVRGSSFALEVIVQIGLWRFWKRWTVAQIHEMLTQERHMLISEREVLYLIEVFLVLLRCTYDLRLAEHAAYFRQHGLFVAIDALKPEKGNTALYVVRELKFGLILHQAALLSTAHQTLATQLLQPVKDLGYRVRGLVSDDEKALQLAAAVVFPGVAHQTCQLHCLCDAARPIAAADQAFKKALKQAIRGPFYSVCRAIDQLAADDPCLPVLRTYADLIRTTLTEGSKPPFALGGLRVFEDLTRLEASLLRSRKKGAIRFWINSWPSFNVVARSRLSTTVSSVNGIGWSNWSAGWIRPSKPISHAPRAVRSSGTSKTFWPSWNNMPKRALPMPRWWRISAQPSSNGGRDSAHVRRAAAVGRCVACYAWPERWRTNNDLESFFGRLRTRQRQIHGRKSVHEFILRYGEWAIYIDPAESFDQVLQRFQQFDQAKFDAETARFRTAQLKLRVQYRFRHNPRRCLKELEQQWDAAIHYKSRKSAV
jgi:hypothetical protein